MDYRTPLTLVAASTLLFAAQNASAQTSGSNANQERLGAVIGALFGDRLGLSSLDQAWLRGGRPLRDGQSQFVTRVDTSVRSGSVSAAAGTRLRSDYAGLVELETRYAADGRITTEERADLNARYTALTRTLDSGAANYGDLNQVAQGRAAFDARVDAAVAARRLSRTRATQLKSDYQALIQIETGYQADGVITAAERADLDARLDALDERVGDSATATPAQTVRVRLAAIDTTLAAAERAGTVSRAEAAELRLQHADLVRLEAAYARNTPPADDAAYLARRVGEIEARLRR